MPSSLLSDLLDAYSQPPVSSTTVAAPVMLPAAPLARVAASPEQPAAPAQVDRTEDRARAAVLEAAAREAGFAVDLPSLRRGGFSRRGGGVKAAIRRFERMPLVADAADAVVAAVAAEQREDLRCRVRDLRMGADGLLAIPREGGAAAEVVPERDACPQAFARVADLAEASSPGAAMSQWRGRLLPLRGLTFDALAAESAVVEDERIAAAEEEARSAQRLRAEAPKGTPAAMLPRVPAVPAIRECTVRTRLDGAGRRAAFAVVGRDYPACDADRVAEACKIAAAGTGLRGEAKYDRQRLAFDMIGSHSLRPERWVAGEAFQVGVRTRSRDDGGGSIEVSVLLFRSMCENLMIVRGSQLSIARIRHVGDPAKIAALLGEALRGAMGRIEHFLKAWNLAAARPLALDARAERSPEAFEEAAKKAALVDEILGRLAPGADVAADLLERSRVVAGHADLVDDLLAGTFRGLAERELLPISPRRMEEALPGLIAAHWDPRNASGALAAGPTRASVANAITLYAHDGQDDEDLELALEEAAGLVLARQAPLPWAPAPAARVRA